MAEKKESKKVQKIKEIAENKITNYKVTETANHIIVTTDGNYFSANVFMDLINELGISRGDTGGFGITKDKEIDLAIDKKKIN